MRPFDGPLRPAYNYAPTTALRHAREDVPSRLTSQPSRPVLAPSSRRASDQDVVLPSVERDPGVPPEATPHERRRGDSVSYVDAQTPKRKSFPSSIYSLQERYPEQAAKRSRPVYDDSYTQALPRAHDEPTNLTSSPMRPANGGQRDYYAGPSNQAYVLAPARDSPRGHIPEYDRPSGIRVLAPIEYSASRKEPSRYPAESGRYRLH
ncbi:hypothetical protein K458DRAFT_72811 [Lentithecium fluviatile CBS 122367]|uniref:Uncharacterized protein n=1 Tax=Lentithecium fluviatile CBS 122367 TaxID=1168545 RepID=A0A6G1IVZ2_9PLEO|nr:hypothetical protein K458DRAFT_72811 [Lentithecium fluviatile CBS 122367]